MAFHKFLKPATTFSPFLLGMGALPHFPSETHSPATSALTVTAECLPLAWGTLSRTAI